MKTKDDNDITTTQRLPAYESMADLVASDPARYYAHKTRIERIDLHKPPRKWRIAGLLRLLRALGPTLIILAISSCQTDTTGLASGPTSPAELDAGVAMAPGPDALQAEPVLVVAPDALPTAPDATGTSPDVLAGGLEAGAAPDLGFPNDLAQGKETARADMVMAKRDVPPCQPGYYQTVTPYQVPGVDALEYGYSCSPYADAGSCVPSGTACTDTLPQGVVTGDTCAAWVKSGLCTATKPEWTTYCDASCGRCKRCE